MYLNINVLSIERRNAKTIVNCKRVFPSCRRVDDGWGFFFSLFFFREKSTRCVKLTRSVVINTLEKVCELFFHAIRSDDERVIANKCTVIDREITE